MKFQHCPFSVLYLLDFNDEGGNYVGITEYGAKQSKYPAYYSEKNFILENGDMAMEYDLVSQIIGISRKYDPAPFAQPSFYIIVRVGGLQVVPSCFRKTSTSSQRFSEWIYRGCMYRIRDEI